MKNLLCCSYSISVSSSLSCSVMCGRRIKEQEVSILHIDTVMISLLLS